MSEQVAERHQLVGSTNQLKLTAADGKKYLTDLMNMLAEVAAPDISLVRNPQGFDESAVVVKEGAKTAKAARLQLEKSTGRPVVSRLNAKKIGARKLPGKKP